MYIDRQTDEHTGEGREAESETDKQMYGRGGRKCRERYRQTRQQRLRKTRRPTETFTTGRNITAYALAFSYNCDLKRKQWLLVSKCKFHQCLPSDTLGKKPVQKYPNASQRYFSSFFISILFL